MWCGSQAGRRRTGWCCTQGRLRLHEVLLIIVNIEEFAGFFSFLLLAALRMVYLYVGGSESEERQKLEDINHVKRS